MKRFISFLISFIISISIYSCAVSNPSWTNIGYDRVYIENCRDTLDFKELDSTLRSNGIYPIDEEWTTIKYYTPEKDEMTQFVYTKKDTTFIINKINSTDYIFFKRYLNKIE